LYYVIYSIYIHSIHSRLTYVPRQFFASLRHSSSSILSYPSQGCTDGFRQNSELRTLPSYIMPNMHTYLIYLIICKSELVNVCGILYYTEETVIIVWNKYKCINNVTLTKGTKSLFLCFQLCF